ncbi:hypothetical protein Hanom_Chr00s053436g01781131 [Helianthus anomalus]
MSRSRTIPCMSCLTGDFLEKEEAHNLPCHPCSPWVFTVPISFFLGNLSPMLLSVDDALLLLCHS